MALMSVLSCNKRIECQNPPPVLGLRIAKVVGLDTTTASNIAIALPFQTGQKSYITDLKNANGIVLTNELINTSYAQKDPSFALEVNNVQVATIQLKTYKDNSSCDGWIHQSELRLNNKPLVANSRGIYFIAL